MTGYWYWETPAGIAKIVPLDGRFHCFLGDDDLGSYGSAQQAVDDFCRGHTFWPSSGADPGALGLPEELGEWLVFPPRAS